MIALDSKGEPFIAWKPGHISVWEGSTLRLVPGHVDRSGPPLTVLEGGASAHEVYARQSLTAAVATATREYGVLAYDVRRPSNVPEIKRARARAASLLLMHQNDDATGRAFTPAQVAKMLQFGDPDRMVALVISAGYPV